jgi:molecular chaperone GrpE
MGRHAREEPRSGRTQPDREAPSVPEASPSKAAPRPPAEGSAAAGAPRDVDAAAAEASTPADPSSGGDRVSVPAAEWEALRRERDEYLDLLQRTRAEYLNFRRRSLKDLEDARAFGLQEFLKSLLPVLDHLDHASEASSLGASYDDFRKGVEIVLAELRQIMEGQGMTPIVHEGVPFDPSVHEAIDEVPREDVPDRTVLEVLRKGYRLRERLLRAAQVRVSRRGKSSNSSGEGSAGGGEPPAQRTGED